MKRTMMILALAAGYALPAAAEDLRIEDTTTAPMSTPDTSAAAQTTFGATQAVTAKDSHGCMRRKTTAQMM